MFNVGGGELLLILLVALIVLGPTRLPGAARQIGQFIGQIRQLSSGFQQELRDALDEPLDITGEREVDRLRRRRGQTSRQAQLRPAPPQGQTPVGTEGSDGEPSPPEADPTAATGPVTLAPVPPEAPPAAEPAEATGRAAEAGDDPGEAAGTAAEAR